MEETIDKAISAVFILEPVNCTKEEWPAVRNALQDWAKNGLTRNSPAFREEFALEEIRRLDRKFSYRPGK